MFINYFLLSFVNMSPKAKEQVKMRSIKASMPLEKTDKTKRTDTKLQQLSVSNPETKTEISKKITKKNPLALKEILYSISKFIAGIPGFFANFLNSSSREIYYAILGTMLSFVFAILLFPNNPGIFSVFFLTIFLAPFVIKEINLNVLLIGRTQKVEEKGVSLTHLKVKEPSTFFISDFYHENKRLLSIYFFFFLGIMLVVIALIALLPIDYSAQLFSQQGWNNFLMPARNIGFEGLNKVPLFIDILRNNFSVMLVCFVVALVFPLGALLMIVWNAMYWAVSFTQYALFYSKEYSVNLLHILIPLLLSVSFHTIIEAICYFFAAMAGTMLATGIRKEKIDSDRFFYIFKYSIILLVFSITFLLFGTFVEVFLFDGIKNFFFSLF